MSHLDPHKLNVIFEGVSVDSLVLPRCYTLTHSDITGDLYLTINSDFDYKQISGLYTRLMRDEVLAEWKLKQDCLFLHVYCHVCGGIVLGTASFRERIFRRELPLVLEAIRYGDRELFAIDPELDETEILVNFRKPKAQDCKVESWGQIGDFKI